MKAELAVRLFDRHAGVLAIDGEPRSPEDWRFAYDQAYLSADALPLSVALPLQREPFAGAIVNNWFGNLLPEGEVRAAIAARLRLSERDDFALLTAIGGECAGAVSLGPQSRPDQRELAEETDLEALLLRLGEDAGEGAWASLGTPRRLSLAGAQDKIAVVSQSDGRLRLPASGEISTHILKPESRRFRGLRDLEALGLALARAVGLDAVHATLRDVAGRKALLVERYDRQVTNDGRAVRLHQEDFCQALGYPAELKYESQGGPSLARCADLIRKRLRLGPVALQGFLDWVVFNVLIGNADAHAKNLALLSGHDGKRTLAPFYDLVPILTLPDSMVDRTPALRIGEAATITEVSMADWRGFALAAGYAAPFVLRRVAAMADTVIAAAMPVADELIAQGGEGERLQRAVATIRENARRMQERFVHGGPAPA